MDTKVGGISGVVDEYAKFARETADYLYERAAGLEKNMTKVMVGSGKEFATKFGERTGLDSLIERNPGRAALLALMTGVMANRMAKSRGAGRWAGMIPQMEAVETSKPETTARPKRTVRRKRAAKAKAA